MTSSSSSSSPDATYRPSGETTGGCSGGEDRTSFGGDTGNDDENIDVDDDDGTITTVLSRILHAYRAAPRGYGSGKTVPEFIRQLHEYDVISGHSPPFDAHDECRIDTGSEESLESSRFRHRPGPSDDPRSDHHGSDDDPDRPFLRPGRGHSVMTVALPPYLRPIDEESEDEEANDPEITNNEETSHSYNYNDYHNYYYYDYDDLVDSFEDDEDGRRKEYGWRLTRSPHKSSAGDICPSTGQDNRDVEEPEGISNYDPAAICHHTDNRSKVSDDASRDKNIGFDHTSSATRRDVTVTSPPETEVFFAWRDWRMGLFYASLVCGSTFFGCLTRADPSRLVACVALASFVSFFFFLFPGGKGRTRHQRGAL